MPNIEPVEPRMTDTSDLLAQAKQYVFLKTQLDYLDKEQKALRTTVFEVIDANGEEDSKGSLVLDFPQEVNGYVSFTKQRRVSRKINEEKAEEIIQAKGLEDTLYKTIRVIDEDALMAALFGDTLTPEEVEEMYPQVITWALILNKK